MEEREVEVLLERVLDGEPDRFAPLVEAYTPALYGLAYKMLGGSSEAADVVQETFFRAYRDLGRFDGRTRFYSWLCGICVNVCYDAGKRRRRAWERERPLPEAGADRLAGSGPNPEAELMAAQDEAGVRGCLGRLPETLRAALLLRYQEDLSLQELAGQLRIGLSAAKMRLQRGLALMKECMSRRLAGSVR
jgi:RNA polymerase sigma-70 factor, ECF subfamily